MSNWREARRGKYSVGFKKRVAAEALAPGASVAKIARSHGLNANMIFGWRKDPRFQPPEKKRKAVEAELASGRDMPAPSVGIEQSFHAVEIAGDLGAVVTPQIPEPPAPARLNEPSPPVSPRPAQTLSPMASAPVEPATPTGRIELVLANGHRLLLSGNVDADAVLRLAQGLAAEGAPS